MTDYMDKLEQDASTYEDLTEIGSDLVGVFEELKATGETVQPLAIMKAALQKLQNLQEKFAPEPCEATVDPAEDGAPAVGRVIMGGLAVSLTRSTTSGDMVLFVENEREIPTSLTMEFPNGRVMWRGEVP